MRPYPSSISLLPKYHERLLVVRLQSSAVALRAAVGGQQQLSPGMETVRRLEREGRIKQVLPIVPLTQSILVRPRQVAFDTMSEIARQRAEQSPGAGVALLELARDVDLEDLQSGLGQDRQNIDLVARVPAHYLLSAKPAVSPPCWALWNARRIFLQAAMSAPSFRNADDIRVAVLDTGIDTEHPDLGGSVHRYARGYPDVPAISDADLVGHGTHVAGTIAAQHNTELGTGGICSCRLHVWKIFSDAPRLDPDTGVFIYTVDEVLYRRALLECLAEQIPILNLSIGTQGEPDQFLRELYRQLLDLGTTVVAAVGNERLESSPVCYPAALPGVIAVGATSLDDRVADFSSAANYISLCAPGVAIWSTLPTYPGQRGFEAVRPVSGSGLVQGKPFPREIHYGAESGTSMAAPHVTAAAALLHAKQQGISGDEVRKRLMSTADHVSGMGALNFHPDYGGGRLNLQRLLAD